MVALSCAGSLNGNILVAGKLALAASEKGYFPSHIDRSRILAQLPSSQKTRLDRLGGWLSQILGPIYNFRLSKVTGSYSSISSEDHDRLDNPDERIPSTEDDSDIKMLVMRASWTRKLAKKKVIYRGNLVIPMAIALVLICLGTFRTLITFIGRFNPFNALPRRRF
jgi:hypothetical protein